MLGIVYTTYPFEPRLREQVSMHMYMYTHGGHQKHTCDLEMASYIQTSLAACFRSSGSRLIKELSMIQTSKAFATGNHEPCGEMARGQPKPHKTPPHTTKQVDAYHFGLRSENFSPFTELS